MNLLKIVATIIITSLVIFAFSGCDDNNNNVTTSSSGDTTSFIAKVVPQDGATNVSSTTSLSVKFSQPMDTLTVMNNFYFSGGNDMTMWMDSANFYGGMGNMNMGMRNHMMMWIDSIQLPGAFHWNNSFDSCEFIPDSTMLPNTEYMMLMYEGGMMNRGGSMMGMNHGDSGYHSYHFTTGPMTNAKPSIVSVTPSDADSNVSPTSTISIKFNMPMDTNSVMANFHLSGGDEMYQWMDSLSHHMGMNGMGMVDMDHMMSWMDSIEINGEFHWNQNMDSCEFIPDSSFMPHTDYMIFMNGSIMNRKGQMMDMQNLPYEGYMYRFTTQP